MKKIKQFHANVIFIVTALSFCLVDTKASSEQKSNALDFLNQKIANGDIQRIELLWRDPSAESRSAISPEELDKRYFQKRNLLCTPHKVECLQLGHILQRQESITPNLDGDPDYRWSIKFFSARNDKPAVSIYLDGSGRNGIINGKQRQFPNSLNNWLLANFFRTPSAARAETCEKPMCTSTAIPEPQLPPTTTPDSPCRPLTPPTRQKAAACAR